MNPEKITTSQIVGSLTPKQWAPIISTTFAAFSIAVSGGFWAGQTLAEAQALGQNAELKANVGQLQARLEVTQSKIDQAEKILVQWQEAYGKTQQVLAQKNAELAQLSSEVGRANNCAFIQRQIVETRQDIDHARFTWSSSAGKEYEEKQKSLINDLEQRLARYQQQLGTCKG